ncbi:uncharacterized protein LOC135212540 [Macrobrachium nipponense]|uniref:uncharacterized protein LOC135212540 n=1 Tax=Macrobrachium nipponense TaxID=159736 RepID=UPI0030C8C74C
MCEGYKLHLDFGYEEINGTKKLVLIPVITKCPEDPGPFIAAAFLSILFVAAFILNLMVVVTVATSYTLKRFLYCHLVVNLSATCMLDCFLNISVAIGYVTTAPWRFGYYLSYFNSFTINMLNSEMAFAVTLLAIDRIAAAKKFTKYLNMSKFNLGVIISATWAVALLMALPLVCGLIMSMPYRNRYSCAVTDPNDDYYLIIHVLLVLCACTLVMVVLVIVTSVVFHKERKKQKIKGNHTMSYFDQILMTPYFRNEFYPAVFVGFTVIFYLFCWLPFTAVSTIGPMVTRHWVNETEEEQGEDKTFNKYIPVQRSGFRMTKAMLDDSQLQKLNQTNITSSHVNTTNITLHPGLIPEIIDTPTYETAFIWLRFLYDLIVPILVFTILRDIRAKSEGLIMCCRPNSVNVASPKPIRPYLNKMSSSNSAEGKETSYKSQKKSSKNAVGFKTPILFATSEGLHIRTVEETYLDMLENKSLMAFAKQHNDAPRFTYDLCDVMLGYEDLTDFEGQFHIDDNYDYDKEPREADLGPANHIVNNASRAALGQKPLQEPVVEDECEEIPMEKEIRPPTPPKVHIKGNDPAISFGETIEPTINDANNDANKPQRGKKSVRFASVLTEEIPRPETGESSVLNSSINSERSSDSGILADSERSSANEHKDTRQPKPIPIRDRKPIPRRGPGYPTKRLQAPPRNPNGVRKPVVTNVRNIKSRHFTKINDSIVSVDEKPPATPRRFSKPTPQRPSWSN